MDDEIKNFQHMRHQIYEEKKMRGEKQLRPTLTRKFSARNPLSFTVDEVDRYQKLLLL